MESPTTLYSPLDEAASQIRLLEIEPRNNDNQTVSCRMRTVSLDDDIKFFALSYVWGNTRDRVEVIVNDVVIPVTRNLEAALRHIQRNGRTVFDIPATKNLEEAPRHSQQNWRTLIDRFLQNLMAAFRQTVVEPESPREETDGHPNPDQAPISLWVDAVCINQADLKERGSQVQLMRRIYSSAETVLAWLGDNDYTDVFEAFEAFSTEIQRCTLADQEVLGSLNWMDDLELFRDGKIWWNIRGFLLHPYWTRVWILQEIALAKQMVLVTSNGSLAWDTVASVSSLLMVKTRDTWSSPSSHARLPKSAVLPLGMNGYMPWMPISRPATLQKFRRISSPSFITWNATLQLAREYAATDPRDHIYGLLGVMELDIKPDYQSKTAADVFRDFASGFLEASRNIPVNDDLPSHPFRFLGCAGIGRHEYGPDMPTWAPNFPSERRKEIQTLEPPGFQRADKGVFLETAGYATIAGNSLCVSGVLLEQIGRVSKPPSEEEDVRLRLLGVINAYLSRHRTYLSGIPPLQAFFRLLQQDVSINVDKPTVRTAFGFLTSLLDGGTAGGTRYIFEPLHALGYPVKWDFETAGQAMDALRTEDLERWFVNSFFPGVQLKDFGLEEMFAHWRNGEEMGQLTEVLTRPAFSHMKMYSIFETPMGLLGLGPSGALPGDIVCILKDCGVPVILREVDSHYLFVGTAFVLGLMDGEARSFVEGGLKVPEVLEIR